MTYFYEIQKQHFNFCFEWCGKCFGFTMIYPFVKPLKNGQIHDTPVFHLFHLYLKHVFTRDILIVRLLGQVS